MRFRVWGCGGSQGLARSQLCGAALHTPSGWDVRCLCLTRVVRGVEVEFVRTDSVILWVGLYRPCSSSHNFSLSVPYKREPDSRRVADSHACSKHPVLVAGLCSPLPNPASQTPPPRLPPPPHQVARGHAAGEGVAAPPGRRLPRSQQVQGGGRPCAAVRTRRGGAAAECVENGRARGRGAGD